MVEGCRFNLSWKHIWLIIGNWGGQRGWQFFYYLF